MSPIAPAFRPLCFVLMPFGTKPDSNGVSIDFDKVYSEVICPAIDDAGLQPIRADEEVAGGIIHKPMFERLILCDFAVADLTTANANVFYELGVRHAMRPFTTVLMSAEGSRPPFDVSMERRLQYRLGADGLPSSVAADRQTLAKHLRAAKQSTDSPIYQLLSDLPPPVIDRLKADVFRDQVQYSESIKARLAQARQAGAGDVRTVEQSLGPIDDVEAGVLVDLFLSYRAVKAWDQMVDLVAKMPPPLASTILVQEQVALALNRLGQRTEAERVLQAVVQRHGPSSETLGLLGRIYKDQWQDALTRGDPIAAAGLLDRAIDTYRRGYEADQREPYPGINAVTLMEIRDPADPLLALLLAAVRYAVSLRAASPSAGYWDHASSLELAVLARDEAGAMKAAGAAMADLAAAHESWVPETTANNLKLIRTARDARGDSPQWALKIEDALLPPAAQAAE